MKNMLRRTLSMLMCIAMLITSIPAWGEEDGTIQVLEMIQTIEEQIAVSEEAIPETEEVPVMEEEPVQEEPVQEEIPAEEPAPEEEIPVEEPAEETDSEEEFEELEEVEITFEDIPELFEELPAEDEAEAPIEENLEQLEEPAALSEEEELAAVIASLTSDVAGYEFIYDKVRTLYVRLLDTASHGEGSTAYDALVKGSANREGYAKAFEALLSAVSVNSEIIYGGGKVWNLVHDGVRWTNDGVEMFDGCWYHVDAYADDGAVFGRHLALTDGAMRADGYEWSGHYYPDQLWETAITKCQYALGRNSIILGYADQVDAQVSAAVQAGHEGQYEGVVFYDAVGVCNLADRVLAMAESLGIADAIHIVDDGCFVEAWFVPASAIVPAAKSITIGLKEQVSIANWTTEPAGSFVKGEVTYSTKSKAIAAIDENGVVTGKKAGSTTVYISAPDLAKVSVKVTVKKEPKKITLKDVPAVLGIGEQAQLGYTLTSGAASAITFKSSDEKVLAVTADGTLIPKAVGSATITASTYVEGVEASAEIAVKAAPTAIQLSEASIVLGKGDSCQLTAVMAENEAGAITFETGDKAIATVDAAGKVKAVKAGSTTITATAYNGVSAQCAVEVKAAPTSVAVTAERTTIGVGESIQLETSLKPVDAETTLTFSSSKGSVASVDEDGIVTAEKAGSATITVKTHNSKKKTIKITVKAAPTSVAIEADRTILGVGEQLQLGYTLNKNSAGSVSFASLDENIATITEDGLLTAVAEGAVVITATTHNGVVGEQVIEVKKAPSKIIKEKYSTGTEYDIVLGKGDTITLGASLPEDEAGQLFYESKNSSVISVDENGKVKALKNGGGIIAVSTHVEGVTAEYEVWVTDAPTSVSVIAERTTLGVGDKVEIDAISNNRNLVTKLIYTSSKPSVATVDEDGWVTGVKAGSATITVKTYNNKKKTVKVTVKKAPTSIEIDAENVVLGELEEVKLGYTLSKNSAGPVTFSTSDRNIVTVFPDNALKAVAASDVPAVITATAYNGVSDSIEVYVKKAPTQILLSETELVLGKGATATLSAALPEGEAGTITFETGDKAIATVDASGKVRGVKVGSTTITAKTYNGVTAVCDVEVKAAPTAVAVTAERTTIGVGEKLQLNTKLTPADSGSTITFSSSKASVATVDEDGVVTAVKAGSATITAKTHNGKKKTIKITVKAAPASVEISAPRTKLAVGETMVLSSSIPSGSVGTVTYATSDETIAAVTAAGEVLAVGEGKVTFTAYTQNPEINASVEVEIVKAPTQVVPSFEWKNIRVGTTASLSYTTDNGNVGPVTYKSGDETIATVDANGTIKGVSVGTAEIFIYSHVDGVYGVANVNICPEPLKIQLDDKVNTIVLGEQLQLEVVMTPVDAMADFTYASLDETVATVDANGVVTAKAAGSTFITVKSHNGLEAALEITVITGPEKVKNLIVFQLSESNLTLVWDESRNTDFYKVYAFENGEWKFLAETVDTFYSADNLALNTEYKFAVEACMNSAEGLLSAEKTEVVRTVVEALVLSAIKADEEFLHEGSTVTWTVYAEGGMKPYNYTFNVYHDGSMVSTSTGDSNVFACELENPGEYYVVVTVEDAYENKAEAASRTVIAWAKPTAINLTAEKDSIYVGDKLQLNVELVPAGAVDTVTFASSDDDIAVVDGNGVVKGTGEGTVTITATASTGASASIQLNVEERPVRFHYDEVGEGVICINGIDGDFSGVLYIPEEYDGMKVDGINDHAFAGWDSITGVVIPETVEFINYGAFENCRNLTFVEFTGDSNLVHINDRVFAECDSLESIVLPESLEHIGNEAFAYCDNLTSVSIPARTIDIGEAIVDGCEYIVITVPKGDSAIRDYAIERGIPYTDGEYTSLHVFKVREVDNRYDVGVGESVTWTADVIGGTGAHQYKYSLVRFDADWVEVFNTGWVSENEFTYEFADGGVYNVIFAVTDGENTIEGVWGVDNIHVNAWSEELPYAYTVIDENAKQAFISGIDQEALSGEIILPDSIDGYTITEIGRGAFSGDHDITSIVIPEGVTYIGVNAFTDMNGLRTVILPDSLEYIAWQAFAECHGLEIIVIPGRVVEIADEAFVGCHNLTDVILEEGVQRIRGYAFAESGIREITIPASVSLDWNAFAECHDLEVVRINEGMTSLEGGAFENCNSLREVYLPESLTVLNDCVFQNCTSLEEINLSNVKHIGNSAFNECHSLGYADLSDAEYIGHAAFANCHSLNGVEFGEGLTSISESAFNNCHSLSNITFPSSMEYVDNWAFTDCHNLGEINLTGREIGFGENVFGGSNVTLIVDKDSSAYHYAREWGYDYVTFGNIETDQYHYEFNHEEKTATIVGYGFEDYIELEGTLNIPEIVEHEGEIYTVTAIGNDVFNDQQGITALYIPGTVKSIGERAFANLRSLRALTISEGVETIDYDAFFGCENLTSVDIPSTVTFIGGGAFAYCWNLREIYFWQDAETEVDFTDDCVLDNSPWAIVYCYADSAAEAFAQRRGIPYKYHDGSFASLAIMDVYATQWAGSEGDYGEWEVVYNGNNVEFLYEVSYNNEVIFESEWTDENTFGWVCENSGKYGLTAYARFAGDDSEVVSFTSGDQMTISLDAQDGSPWRYTIFGEGEDGVTRIGITGYEADIENGELIIPDTIDGNVVDAIMENCFEGRHEINRVVLNESLTSIMYRAFADCDGLESIEFTGSNLYYIANEAFEGCDNLREINLPDSVGVIENAAFANTPVQAIRLPAALEVLADEAFINCGDLAEVDMSAVTKLERIGDRAFHYCGNLQEIAIPDCVKEIGYDAFNDCGSLRKVTLGSGLEIIQSCAFMNCHSLEEINLGDCKNLTFINGSAFEHCCSLREIVIPDSVTEMQHRVFYDCYSLETAVIGSGLNTTRIATFENCHSLRTVVLPENLEGIDSWAFKNCHQLSEINIPANLKFIDECAFESCHSISELTLPASLEYICENAFNGTDIKLIVEMGTYAHERAIECGWNYVPVGEADVNRLCYNHENEYVVINGYDGELEGELVIPAYIDDRPVTVIDWSAFQGRERLTKVVLPETLEVILGYAFSECHNLTAVEYSGSNVKEIYEGAFSGCHSLISAEVPYGVEYLGHNAFAWCEQLQELHIPESVERFDDMLIEGSSRCVLYVQPGSAAETYAIEKGLPYDNGTVHPFKVMQVYCTKGTDVVGDYAEWTAYIVGADQCATAQPYDFQLYRDGELYKDFGWSADPFVSFEFTEGGYYEMALRMRKTASESTATELCFSDTMIIGWEEEDGMFRYTYCGENEITITSFTGMDGNTLVIPEKIGEATVVGISANAFSGRGEIQWVELPSTIRFIDEYAFANLHELFGINLQDTQIERIGAGAFENCHQLDNVVFPATLREIGEAAFNRCESIREIVIPANVEYMGERCFIECYGLNVVAIESTKLEEIPYAAFAHTHSLQIAVIPNGVKTIRDEAFIESGVSTVVLPSTLENIDSNAFNRCCNLQEINLGDCHKLTYLGESVFNHCCSLREIELPASVDFYGNNLFSECYSLEKAVLNAVARVEVDMIDPDGTEWVDVVYTTRWSTFAECHSLREVVLPENTTSIANWAFQNCHSLESINVPASVVGIGEFAFENCHSLNIEITLGENIYNIEDGVFDNCPAVLCVYPDTYAYHRVRETDWNYTIIGAEADPNAIHFEFSENGEEAIVCGYDGDLVGDLVIPAYAEDGEGIARPVTVINEWAFCGAYDLMSVTIPETVQFIGKGAFADCQRLRTVTIAEGSQLDEIDRNAFEYCPSMTSINLEAAEDLRIIGNWAFVECYSLNSLTFPASIEEIGEGITEGCPLIVYYVTKDSVAEAYAIENGIAYDNGEGFALCLQYVRIEEEASWPGDRATWRAYAIGGDNIEYKYHLYRAGEGVMETDWTDSDTFSYEEFTENGAYMVGVTVRSQNSDGSYTYYPVDENGNPDRKYADGEIIINGELGDTGLFYTILSNEEDEEGLTAMITGASEELEGEITIPGSIHYNDKDYEVIQIASHAFNENWGITGVTIEDGVRYIGDRAFYRMENLRYLNLPSTLEEISESMAGKCWSLEEVNAGGADVIGDNAFIGCHNLRSITLSGNVREIRSWAFAECHALESIELTTALEEIGDHAFAWCHSLQLDAIPESVYCVRDYAFEECHSIGEIYISDRLEDIGENIFCNAGVYVIANVGAPILNYCMDWGYDFEAVGEADSGCIIWGHQEGGAWITGYDGQVIGDLVIPETVIDSETGNHITVTGIFDNAFMDQDGLMSVFIPASVQIISDAAFANCDRLRTVIIGEGSQLTEIVSRAFVACQSLHYVELHNAQNLETIGEQAFAYGSSLEEIVIPASVKEMGNDIFAECPRVRLQVTAGSTAETYAIENDLLYDNGNGYALTVMEVTVERWSNFQGEEAEWRAHAIGGKGDYQYQYQVIRNGEAYGDPSGWTSSETFTFQCNETGVYRVNAQVKDATGKVTDYVRCESAMVVRMVDAETTIHYAEVGDGIALLVGMDEIPNELVIPENVAGYTIVEIVDYAFEGRGEIESVTIPETVGFIGERAFAYCENLHTVNLPGSLTGIGDRAFISCRSLRDIELPNGLITLENGAFVECESLEEIVIPNSVTNIGDCMFAACFNLRSVKLPAGMDEIGPEFFGDCHSLESIEIPDNVTVIGNRAFWNCHSLREISIPASVKTIEDGAFECCCNLEALNLNNGLEYIGAGAFVHCESLRELIMPDSITKVRGQAFDSCYNLETVRFSNNLENITNWSFASCYALKEIVVPASVNSIGAYAFCDCVSLEKVTLPENGNLTIIEQSAFFKNESLKEIVIPDTVTQIDQIAFDSCYSLESVKLPANLTELNNWTFANCHNLNNVVVPDGVTRIGKAVFAENYALTSIILPDGLEYIGVDCFVKDGSLTALVIPESVQEIGENAFGETNEAFTLYVVDGSAAQAYAEEFGIAYETTNGGQVYQSYLYIANDGGAAITAYLGSEESLIVPETINGLTVTEIGDGAFEGNTTLTEIDLPDTVEIIGARAFANCTSLAVMC